VNERHRQEEIGRRKRAEGIDWRSCADPAMDGGDGTRFLVLGEEVGEVANAVLEAGYQGEPGNEHLRNEVVQIAAVAMRWVDSIDARPAMSVGRLCTCPKHPPGRQRQNGEPACPHYAANQQTGGHCTSCASGFHAPCDSLTLPADAPSGLTPSVKVGECLRCRWWSAEHTR
jgi:hypothetical protein